MNFYEQPSASHEVLRDLLSEEGRNSDYIQSFTSVNLLSIDEIKALPPSEATRPIRQAQMYWAILFDAGFNADESRLRGLFKTPAGVNAFDPHFKKAFRDKVHGGETNPPNTLAELRNELRLVTEFMRNQPGDADVQDLFKPDEQAMLGFLVPKAKGSTGPGILNRYRNYHDPNAADYIAEVLDYLDEGQTVILDLGNATDKLRAFFADSLSRAVFSHQEGKFTADELGSHYVQLYFEEAHNLFPASAKDLTGVYARFAKEGAKFHIGMTYSTQSPSTIYGELLVQTENFFVGHLASVDEARSLSRLQNAFAGVEEDIMRSRTPGYMRMLTRSHRFVIPVQARLFEARTEA